MQQAISRNNDNAIPLRKRYLSDQLPCMVLTLWKNRKQCRFKNKIAFHRVGVFSSLSSGARRRLPALTSHLSVWGCSWCWPLGSLAGCGSDTTAWPGHAHWRGWPITVVVLDEVADFLKILYIKKKEKKRLKVNRRSENTKNNKIKIQYLILFHFTFVLTKEKNRFTVTEAGRIWDGLYYATIANSTEQVIHK